MSIKANVGKGSLVTQIQATDADAGPNARVTYSLYSEARHSLVDVLEVGVLTPGSGAFIRLVSFLDFFNFDRQFDFWVKRSPN